MLWIDENDEVAPALGENFLHWLASSTVSYWLTVWLVLAKECLAQDPSEKSVGPSI
jgi:hypothetical protein